MSHVHVQPDGGFSPVRPSGLIVEDEVAPMRQQVALALGSSALQASGSNTRTPSLRAMGVRDLCLVPSSRARGGHAWRTHRYRG